MGGQDSRGFIVVTLADWADRTRSQQEIVAEIERQAARRDRRAGLCDPAELAGHPRGAGRACRFALVGDDYGHAGRQRAHAGRRRWSRTRASGRCGWATTPRSRSCSSRSTAPGPRIWASNIDGLGEALQAVLDGRTVGTVFLDDDSFDIQLVSTVGPGERSRRSGADLRAGAATGRWCRSRPSSR